MTTNKFPATPLDDLQLVLALRQSCSALEVDEYDLSSEAIRCLRLLEQALDAMPLPHEGPARQHLNWAYLTRLRAQQALLTLPQDRTAPITPPRARVPYEARLQPTQDWLAGTFLPDQSRLIALRDDVKTALTCLGCDPAQVTAEVVRNLVRCTRPTSRRSSWETPLAGSVSLRQQPGLRGAGMTNRPLHLSRRALVGLTRHRATRDEVNDLLDTGRVRRRGGGAVVTNVDSDLRAFVDLTTGVVHELGRGASHHGSWHKALAGRQRPRRGHSTSSIPCNPTRSSTR